MLDLVKVYRERERNVCNEGQSGWDAIKYAIVMQAVNDYKMSLRYSKYPVGSDENKKERCKEKAIYMAQECRDFFLGQWRDYLCGIEGQKIIDKLDAEFLQWEKDMLTELKKKKRKKKSEKSNKI